MGLISKGFRMRRDHEAKQELGISTDENRRLENPERPLSKQSSPNEQPPDEQRSLLSKLWRSITG